MVSQQWLDGRLTVVPMRCSFSEVITGRPELHRAPVCALALTALSCAQGFSSYHGRI